MEDEKKEEVLENSNSQDSSDEEPVKHADSGLMKNPWMVASVVLGLIVIVFLVNSFFGITGGAVLGDNVVGEKVVDYLNTQTGGGIELVSVLEFSGLYEIVVSYQGQEISVYATKDGENLIQGVTPIISSEDLKPMSECLVDYDFQEDVIFYYSDSCGWCSKMKPGVEELESQGYKIKWIKAGENSEIISKCVAGYMKGSGVPQFICPKTNEIHTGAFADAEANLDLEAMKQWVDECVNAE
jgi:hypothetical protein